MKQSSGNGNGEYVDRIIIVEEEPTPIVLVVNLVHWKSFACWDLETEYMKAYVICINFNFFISLAHNLELPITGTCYVRLWRYKDKDMLCSKGLPEL